MHDVSFVCLFFKGGCFFTHHTLKYFQVQERYTMNFYNNDFGEGEFKTLPPFHPFRPCFVEYPR